MDNALLYSNSFSVRLILDTYSSPVTIENLPDRDFTSEQVANKLPTTSVLFNVGIVETLSSNSL
jgi:hypothetical protein